MDGCAQQQLPHHPLGRGMTGLPGQRALSGAAHAGAGRRRGRRPAAAAPPTTLPDPRSMFLGFYYSFMPLPAQAMHGRRADDRIGHFVSTSQDFPTT
jgi:hypothetical protein